MLALFTTTVKYARPDYNGDEYELIASSSELSERDANNYAAAIKNMLVSLGYVVVETILRPTRYVPMQYYMGVEE